MPDTASDRHWLRAFIHDHDDLPAFHAAYLVMTFLAAAVFNLGFFLLLILVHMGFDFVKYREVHSFSIARSAKAMILESLSDLVLLAICLSCILYLHSAYGLPFVSGITRSLSFLFLAAMVLLPKFNVLAHLETVFFHIHKHLHMPAFAYATPLSVYQKAMIALLIVNVGFIASAPIVYGAHAGDLLWILQRQLIPWSL